MVAITRLSVAAALLLGVSAVVAQLPAPSVIGDVFFNLSPPAPARVSSTEFGTVELSHPGFGALSLVTSGTPAPFITATADIGLSSTAGLFGRAVGIVNYAFEILGPTGTVPVLIDVAGGTLASADAGASFVVQSRWDLLDGSGTTSLAGDIINSGQLSGSFDQSFAHTVAVTLTTNRTYSVFMLADAEAAATDAGSHAQASAFIDPRFSFGSGVDGNLFAFHFSDGIGNVGAVPEPNVLVLVLAGLAAIGGRAGLRRRR